MQALLAIRYVGACPSDGSRKCCGSLTLSGSGEDHSQHLHAAN